MNKEMNWDDVETLIIYLNLNWSHDFKNIVSKIGNLFNASLDEKDYVNDGGLIYKTSWWLHLHTIKKELMDILEDK